MTIEDKYQAACKTPSDIFEHLPTLRRYAAKCGPRWSKDGDSTGRASGVGAGATPRGGHVTELGVRTIVSTWAFLAGLKDGAERPPSPRPSPPGEGEDAPRLVSVDAIHPRDAGGDLDEVIRLARQEEIWFEFYLADDRLINLPLTDLLFIDTWHVYDQLRLELERHAGQARKFIILHDTETFGLMGETPGHRGLKPALEEFLSGTYGPDGTHWRVREHLTNCNGLTVLERTPGKAESRE